MMRLFGTLGDLPIFRVCQTLAVLRYRDVHTVDSTGNLVTPDTICRAAAHC